MLRCEETKTATSGAEHVVDVHESLSFTLLHSSRAFAVSLDLTAAVSS